MKAEKTSNNFGLATKLAFKENWLFIAMFSVISLIAEIFILHQSKVALIQFDDGMKVAGEGLGSLYKYFNTTSVNWTPSNEFLTRFLYFNQGVAYALIIVLFFVVMKNFSFLYSKRKEDLFLALPINRTATILAKIISIFSIVIAVFGVQVIVGACGTIMIKNLGIFVESAPLFNSICTNFCFLAMILSIFIFCAVVSGRKFHYAALSILIILVHDTAIMAINLSNYFLPNYAILRSNRALSFSNALSNFSYNRVITLGSYLIVAMAFIALSIVFFKKRKAESAESRIAFRLPVTIAMLAVQLFGFILAPAVVTIFEKKISYFALFPICVITTAVFTVIGELILTKLKNKKILIIQYSAVTLSLVCLSLCFIGLNSSVTHTEKVINAKDVDEVVYYDQFYSSPVEGILIGDSQYFISRKISAQANIQKILDIVNNTVMPEGIDGQRKMRICLKLKSGKTLITEGYTLYLQEISDNQDAVNNEKFYETDLNDVDFMLVSADISIDRVDLSIVRDKEEMKSIRDGMDKNSKKIHLDSNNYAVWGRIHLIKLNDDIPQKDKEELQNLTDEQLKWVFENNLVLNKKYGETSEAVAVDSYLNSIVEGRTGKSTMIIEKNSSDLTKQSNYDLQKYIYG